MQLLDAPATDVMNPLWIGVADAVRGRNLVTGVLIDRTEGPFIETVHVY